MPTSGIVEGKYSRPTSTAGDKYEEGMKLAPNYLHRTGYRLPSEAEWEYACRAGAVTSRYYGETEELLPRYGWYSENAGERAWPVGSKKPNDLGLFDMHGNVWAWCQEKFKNYPQGKETVFDDMEDILSISKEDALVLRGGSFANRGVFVRSARRTAALPGVRDLYYGFRAARTIVAE
jgi:formylglycine-generating enzyme required for sulfatase activity